MSAPAEDGAANGAGQQPTEQDNPLFKKSGDAPVPASNGANGVKGGQNGQDGGKDGGFEAPDVDIKKGVEEGEELPCEISHGITSEGATPVLAIRQLMVAITCVAAGMPNLYTTALGR